MALQVQVKFFFLLALFGCFIGLGSSAMVDPKESKLVLYGKSSKDIAEYTLSQAKDLASDERFKGRNTTIFIPDFTESRLKVCDSHVNADAYTKTQVANFITLFYSPMKDKADELDDVDVEGVSAGLAAFLSDMNDLVDWKTIQLLGYASGSILTAQVAKDLDEEYGLKLSRISLLDPTVESQDVVQKYVKADFFDAIHTDSNKYGIKMAIADADFYPNAGTEQIQCYFQETEASACNNHDTDKCSQRLAWKYWADSVSNGPSGGRYYCGHHSDSSFNYEGKPVVMGYYCPWTARGSYVVFTRTSEPFAQDKTCE